MKMDKQQITEISQIECIYVMKSLIAKYPLEKDDSLAIILDTLENVLSLLLVGLEKGTKPKDVMKQVSKNTLLKVRSVKENIEEYKKNKEDVTQILS